ncbi:MAG: DNA polymerase III subunit gamma/tau [Alphaproteobacteria bacterium]|nr:DNA polymerase III subunit gamma/tau [Alphaproteobacteria bacterium]
MNDSAQPQPYRVLARKYRPTTFAGLIGQEAMVRTLTNAIAADRLPHAFVLTGVRGIGKTSTARIIARALNCVGPDGAGGPTAAPCGQCEHCVSIAEDRHVDVLEMDAASRTGVNDIRELIDGVRYRPTSARYKIYIIDEVHMLSTAAFNALLKTLEEPPEHVKFVFATTEIRKVPVTVLSRCQRFDLRRVDAGVLVRHFASIAEQEGAKVAEGALGLIARAADGSVRDGLSLMDQAIAHAGMEDGGEVTETLVRDMLGLADGERIYDLYDALMRGAVSEALDIFGGLYSAGADPAIVLQDLLDVTHWLTRLRLAPEAAAVPGIAEMDRIRGGKMAETLSVPVLSRVWQVLLKGLGEVRNAPSATQAAEMVLIRLAYLADLPSPAELAESLRGNAAAPPASSRDNGAAGPPSAPVAASGAAPAPSAPGGSGGGGARASALRQPQAEFAAPPEALAPPDPGPPAPTGPQNFAELVALFAERREALLHAHLVADTHPVRFQPGHVEFRPGPNAPSDLATRVAARLRDWTGAQWLVSVSSDEGDPTLQEQRDAAAAARHGAAVNHPLVRAALETFPGARVEAVYEREAEPPDAAPLPAPDDDEDDPEDGDPVS